MLKFIIHSSAIQEHLLHFKTESKSLSQVYIFYQWHSMITDFWMSNIDNWHCSATCKLVLDRIVCSVFWRKFALSQKVQKLYFLDELARTWTIQFKTKEGQREKGCSIFSFFSFSIHFFITFSHFPREKHWKGKEKWDVPFSLNKGKVW